MVGQPTRRTSAREPQLTARFGPLGILANVKCGRRKLGTCLNVKPMSKKQSRAPLRLRRWSPTLVVGQRPQGGLDTASQLVYGVRLSFAVGVLPAAGKVALMATANPVDSLPSPVDPSQPPLPITPPTEHETKHALAAWLTELGAGQITVEFHPTTFCDADYGSGRRRAGEKPPSQGHIFNSRAAVDAGDDSDAESLEMWGDDRHGPLHEVSRGSAPSASAGFTSGATDYSSRPLSRESRCRRRHQVKSRWYSYAVAADWFPEGERGRPAGKTRWKYSSPWQCSCRISHSGITLELSLDELKHA